MTNARLAAIGLALLSYAAAALSQSAGLPNLAPAALREWLTYLSSDELEGRATFSEGLGLAAAYIAEQLKAGGVKPGGDRGLYFQRVAVLGVKSTNRSSVIVEVNGETRTFRNGEGVTFPPDVGGKQNLTLDKIEFVGYGLNLGPAYNDFKDADVKNKVIVWLGNRAPRSVDPNLARPVLRSRASLAVDDLGAAATISAPSFDGQATTNRDGRGGRSTAPDFTTVKRLNVPTPPMITASDELLEFLFSAADIKYAELKAKADAQEDLPKFALRNVKLTFNIDADYDIVSTRYTRNVVGIVEGGDPQLKNTYVAFGAHYDHTGYEQGALEAGATDRIYNGADDDGSGTTTLIGLARTFAQGPKPKRSTVFVWHTGEEIAMWGSEYFADRPIVPIGDIVAQINIDMIGRNRDDKESEANSLLAVGSDRISTELHNILIDANSSLPRPLSLDFEMNDPADPERIYYRSDHYSYAAKGVPVIFLFSGLHQDYHRVTDTIDKINFEKMSRVGHLVYELGRRLANLDHAPVRDFKGPRMGRGATGKIGAK